MLKIVLSLASFFLSSTKFGQFYVKFWKRRVSLKRHFLTLWYLTTICGWKLKMHLYYQRNFWGHFADSKSAKGFLFSKMHFFAISAVLENYFLKVGRFWFQKRFPHENCILNVFFEIFSNSTTTRVILIYVKSMYSCVCCIWYIRLKNA